MGITLRNGKQVTKNMTIKGDDGVGIKTITSGTPVITEEKTTTPITVTLTDETTQNFNVEAKNGSDADNVLTKPTIAPSATQIVAVDNTNTQTMLNIGSGLSITNNTLSASGGSSAKKYAHYISFKIVSNRVESRATTLIISSSSEPFTAQAITNYLISKGISGVGSGSLPISATPLPNVAFDGINYFTAYLVGLTIKNENQLFCYGVIIDSNNNPQEYSNNAGITSVNDIVVEI